MKNINRNMENNLSLNITKKWELELVKKVNRKSPNRVLLHPERLNALQKEKQ
jgi:hypothetical protein